MSNVRKRFYAESCLAVLLTGLVVLTMVWPDWIEELTGLDPDAHNGSVEWMFVAGLVLAAAVSALQARREYRRTA
jgi:hypothetical protein